MKLQAEESLTGFPYPFKRVLSNNNKNGRKPITGCTVPEICMYVRMYVHMYVCVYVCMYVCVYVLYSAFSCFIL